MRNIGIIISVLLMLVGSVAVGQEIEVERGIDRLRDAAEFKGASEAPRIARRDDGFLRHLGAPPGRSFTTPAALAASPPADRASAFLDENKVALGLGDGQNGLQVKKEKRDGSRTFVHFQQTYSGLKVFGATAVVQVDDQGIGAVISDIMADAGPLRDDAGFLDPLLSREEAEVLALKATMSSLRSGLLVALSEEDSFEEDLAEIQQSLLIGDESDLVVYAPSVLGKEGEPRLVWNVVVGLEGGVPVAERVLVDALFGDIALQYSLVHELTWLTRQIFDDDNKRYSNAVLVRGEYEPPTGIAEADVLYDHVGDTYDFYHDHHARHILWGGIYGMQVKAVSRFCDLWIDLQIDNEICPTPGAFFMPGAPFFGPRKVMFGDGFAVADDVVAHELTHGVTFFESELEYIGESGAINESLSDIWGEFVDQTNGSGTDTAAVKWLLGEDLAHFLVNEPFRDMEHPPTYGQPDRRGYPGYDPDANVHINSGVNNKLCFLLTDGGTFNGQTVTAMGMEKVVDLYYYCQVNLLGPTSDYEDLYADLTLAAINLGMTTAEKNNINAAMLAVEIDP